MKNFRCLQQGIDIRTLLDELEAIENVWGLNTGRQERIAVQREAKAVALRGLRKSAIVGRERRDVHESRWTNGSRRFPRFRAFLSAFERETGGALGRAKIVCLPAGNRVYPHTDRGEYYKIRNRYHLVLKSALGSWLKAGDEEVRMREGELWWFDNKAVHEAFNDGTEDRIHLIFDHLPAGASASNDVSADAQVRTSPDVPVQNTAGVSQ